MAKTVGTRLKVDKPTLLRLNRRRPVRVYYAYLYTDTDAIPLEFPGEYFIEGDVQIIAQDDIPPLYKSYANPKPVPQDREVPQRGETNLILFSIFTFVVSMVAMGFLTALGQYLFRKWVK